MPESLIRYCGQTAKVNCDGNCKKAWGSSTRPKIQISNNINDYAFLADNELGIAPVDPETYEGECSKPDSSNSFPNKWCVRECERCSISMPGEFASPLELKCFDKRVFNLHERRKNV